MIIGVDINPDREEWGRKFGMTHFINPKTTENVVEIARLAEDLGYHSLWTFQRLLAAVDADGAPLLLPQYRSVLDPIALLAYLAAVTDRVRLGVAVLNLPFASPVVTAKSLTTIDRLSHGRLDVGAP